MALDLTPSVMLVILAMTLVTILTRWLGFFVIGFVRIGPRLEAGFRTLPGAVAAATIAPMVVADALSMSVAVVVSAIVARKGGSDLLAVLAGLGVAILIRAMGG